MQRCVPRQRQVRLPGLEGQESQLPLFALPFSWEATTRQHWRTVRGKDGEEGRDCVP